MTTAISEKCLHKLFRDSHCIHELTSLLQEQSINIQEISMNAAVAAGQSGNQSRVFAEIAKQIGMISSLMIETISEIQITTGKMNNRMLECIVKSAQYNQFSIAQELLKEPKNRELVEQTIDELVRSMVQLLEASARDLQSIKTHYRHLLLVNNRIWSIAMNLKISANMVEAEERSFFSSIAESLEQMNVKTVELAQEFSRVTRTVEEGLGQRCRGAQKQLSKNEVSENAA